MKTIELSLAVADDAVIEMIRNKMPVATLGKKGLADDGLLNSFTSKTFNLADGESANIGIIAGLCIVRHRWSSSASSFFLVDNYTKTMTQIAGRDYKALPLEFIWEDNSDNYARTLSIKSTYKDTAFKTPFIFAYQRLF